LIIIFLLMRRLNCINFAFLVSVFIMFFSETISGISASSLSNATLQDTLITNQILFNGRAWRNNNTTVKGDPYLFSSQFLTGSVTISGRNFQNNYLLYDIYNDELLILSDKHSTIKLNKELLNGFTLDFNNQVYRFVKVGTDSLGVFKGFVNELYGGKSAVYVKYRKLIQIMAVDNKYDAFYQVYRIYVIKDGMPQQVNNKKQLVSLFGDNRQKILDFIRSHRITISSKHPESFVHVAEYYDSLKK
jgi:hypothetical protein